MKKTECLFSSGTFGLLAETDNKESIYIIYYGKPHEEKYKEL